MCASFENHVLTQIKVFTNWIEYENKVYVFRKKLDEIVAACILLTSKLN